MFTQVKIRIDDTLHLRLKKRAKTKKNTMNKEIIERLKESFREERQLRLLKGHVQALVTLLVNIVVELDS